MSGVRRLIYVSCGFKSFQRDASFLLGGAGGGGGAGAGGGGGWRLVHAEGHVLFPGSDHLETLAIFDRI